MYSHHGAYPLLLGIIIILVRLYTTWDIWIVLGVLLVIKGLMVMKQPCCESKKKSK